MKKQATGSGLATRRGAADGFAPSRRARDARDSRRPTADSRRPTADSQSPASAAVLLSIEVKHARAAAAGRVLRAAAREQLLALGLARRELSVSLVSDRAMRSLNAQHRGTDQPTDVLSFPQEEPRRARRAQGPIGDVVISLHTAMRQANEGGWTLAAELRRLLAHGLLHCLGHDHGTAAQARSMARAERALLGREGLAGDSLSAGSSKKA